MNKYLTLVVDLFLALFPLLVKPESVDFGNEKVLLPPIVPF